MRKRKTLWQRVAFPTAMAGCVALGLYVGFVVPGQEVRKEMLFEGYSDVSLSTRVFSGHLTLTCSSKYSRVMAFRAMKAGQAVSGIVCYNGLTGTGIWDDK